jgi:hypothetical protein
MNSVESSKFRVYRNDLLTGCKFSDDNLTWFDLDPKPSQRLVSHSPDGFNFGYVGSGSLQLSLALLLDTFDSSETALKYYRSFCLHVVSKLKRPWILTTEDIEQQIRLYASDKKLNPLIFWLSS